MFEEIRMILQPDGTYIVSVTKSFEPEYGGGHEVFTVRSGKGPHEALDTARSMVTVSPTRNSLVLQES